MKPKMTQATKFSSPLSSPGMGSTLQVIWLGRAQIQATSVAYVTEARQEKAVAAMAWFQELPRGAIWMYMVGLALLSIFLYTSALILWLLYQFDENFGGQPQWSSDVSCRHQLTPLSVHLGPKTGCSHLDSGQPADLRG